MLKEVFNKLKNIQTYPCVSLILPTHRTAPENQQDPLRLKNLIKNAEERLQTEHADQDVSTLLSNLHQLADKIDHQYNLEGLAIFVDNDGTAEYVRIPFEVEERVIIDHTFATRDLIRAIYMMDAYYVLTLSQKKIRLFRGVRDHVVELHEEGFPYDNKFHIEGNEKFASFSKENDNETKEFFNGIDKSFQLVHNKEPHDIVLAGVVSNIARYKEVIDHPNWIMASAEGNYDNAKEHEVAAAVWPEVKEALKQRKQEVFEKLEVAVSQQKFSTDLSHVWRAVNEGRGDTLIVEQGYFAPAQINGDGTEVKLDVELNDPETIDDIIDDIAEIVLKMKGNVIFVEDGQLEKYQRMALIHRW